MADKRIELSQVLRYVSQELQNADKEARDTESPVMQFEECKLEFAVSAEKEASGGIKVWVLNLGGKAKKSESHTITVTMKAISGRPIVAIVEEEEGENRDKPHKRQTKPDNTSR